MLNRSKHLSLQGSLQINFDQIILFVSIKVSLYGSWCPLLKKKIMQNSVKYY